MISMPMAKLKKTQSTLPLETSQRSLAPLLARPA
jgi:hypothetical protein